MLLHGFRVTTCRNMSGYSPLIHLRSCLSSIADAYHKLGITDVDCSDRVVKEAYIELSKLYHPDSGRQESDNKKFTDIHEAFTQIMISRRNSRQHQAPKVDVPYGPEDDDDTDDMHAAPQHRRYLSFQGIGVGTPSQRQKQYQQTRVMEANNRIIEYRIQKLQSELNPNNELTLLEKDRKASQKIKTRNLIDRLVEDLIQESMAKGEFDNLRGSGKPLPQKEHMYNPYIDSSTLNLNRILIQNGYTPEWVTLDKSIREDRNRSVEQLINVRRQLGNYPFHNIDEVKKWEIALELFNKEIKGVNKTIDKYNLIVPSMFQQRMHVRDDKIVSKIMEDNSLAYTKEKSEIKDYAFSVNNAQDGDNVFREFLRELSFIFKSLKRTRHK